MSDIQATATDRPLTYHMELDSVREELESRKKQEKINVGDPERLVSSLAGGALAVLGLTRRNPLGFALAALGSALVYRGVTGHCNLYQGLGVNTATEGESGVQQSAHDGIHVQRSVTIMKPAEEVFAFWRNFENLPKFMNHLESVTCLGPTRSHWVAKAPAGRTVEWDAEIINERENELIAWRSLEGADVDNVGSVRFNPAPEGRGTEVHVNLRYNPPAGRLGAMVAKLFGEEPKQQISGDLRRLKQVLENGEVPTIEGQSRGTCS